MTDTVQINKFISIKLKVISFISMIMVIFIHANNIEISRGYNSWIQIFISDGISRIAVPLFFSIAAYLFFLNMDGSYGAFVVKCKKRFKSLVVPYLFWSCWGLFIFFFMQLIPLSHGFFNGKFISDYSFSQLMDTILLNPVTYQLWFVRDLIVLVILSPLVYFMIQRLHIFVVLFFLIIWYFGYNLLILTPDSIFFYMVGAYISIKKPVVPLHKFAQLSIIAVVVWLLLITGKTILEIYGRGDIFALNLIRKAGILAGVFSVWFGFDKVFNVKNAEKLYAYSIFSFSFFLYAFHEPILTIIEKLLFYFLGEDNLKSVLIYFMVPLIVIPFSVLIGYLLKRKIPEFYHLVTGGR